MVEELWNVLKVGASSIHFMLIDCHENMVKVHLYEEATLLAQFLRDDALLKLATNKNVLHRTTKALVDRQRFSRWRYKTVKLHHIHELLKPEWESFSVKSCMVTDTECAHASVPDLF